jgi:hypothetical protein
MNEESLSNRAQQPQERYTGNNSQRQSRNRQLSFGLPFEGSRRLRQVSFGLGLSFGKDKDDDDDDDNSENNNDDNESPDNIAVCADSATQQQDDHDHGNKKTWGRGIVSDFRRTVLTHWVKEMTNLNQTVIATTFFLFFACIAPAITFGKLIREITNNEEE